MKIQYSCTEFQTYQCILVVVIVVVVIVVVVIVVVVIVVMVGVLFLEIVEYYKGILNWLNCICH